MKNLEIKSRELSTIDIKDKLPLSKMENLIGGGTNRKCLIDGMLTAVGFGIGGVIGGWGGAAGALVAGLYSGNANGCFSKAEFIEI